MAAAALEAPYGIGTNDWDSGPEGGSSYYGNATVDDGAATNWLGITFADTANSPGPSWHDTVRVPATALFTGTYTSNQFFQFDLWGSNVAPDSLTDGTDRSYTGATEDQFLSDLNSRDWIGAETFRGSKDTQAFGIDNFMLMVPEPAEWLMLLIALLVTHHATRKRRLTA